MCPFLLEILEDDLDTKTKQQTLEIKGCAPILMVGDNTKKRLHDQPLDSTAQGCCRAAKSLFLLWLC